MNGLSYHQAWSVAFLLPFHAFLQADFWYSHLCFQAVPPFRYAYSAYRRHSSAQCSEDAVQTATAALLFRRSSAFVYR